ncbi:MAG TPA: response regulator [Terriglobales bacterium]|nr:response regulator [Terriglobales bacterium]
MADSQLMEGVLSQIGYRTRTAHDGQSVLREAGEHRPDLMLLDVSLPDVSGIEICRNLRTEPG